MVKSEPRECKCGCGDWTRGGRFLPGHDAKYHSAQRKLYDAARELVEYFDNDRRGPEWLNRAACRFADYDYTRGFLNRRDVAIAILTHPRMQDTEYNRRNGWTPYTTPSELWHRILRACS